MNMTRATNNRMYVRPAPGLTVLHPHTGQPLPADGAWVPNITHWRRALRAGDVVAGRPTPRGKGREKRNQRTSDEDQS